MFGNLPTFQEVVMMIPGVLMGLTFHEFGHAWVADRLGDDTARRLGRVSLSPLAHLDLLGTLLLFVAGFGWAKPVPVNVSRLRPRIWGDIAVSLAGVAMNFLLACFFLAAYWMAHRGMLFGLRNPVLDKTLVFGYVVNLTLIGFNLIPLPPLDGFRVAQYLFPPSAQRVVHFLYSFGPYILMGLFLTDFADFLLEPIYGVLGRAIEFIVLTPLHLIFG